MDIAVQPPPQSPAWTTCIVKLFLNEEHVSSIPVSRLMAATESEKVSYSNLVRFTKLSAKFASPSHSGRIPPTEDRHVDVQLHYRDEDGDDVLFTTDVELMEALRWASAAAANATGGDATLCVHARLIPHRHSMSSITRSSHRKPSDSSTLPLRSTDSLNASRDDSAARGKKKGLAEFIRKIFTPPPPLIKAESRCTSTAKSNAGEVLICGLADMLGSAGMMIEAHEIATQGKLASLHSERVVKKGVDVVAALRRGARIGGGYKQVILTPPSPDTFFDPAFVHKRHVCDGCHQDPIVGSRYHAVPNIDLCRRCFDAALELHSGNDYNGSDDENRKPDADAAADQKNDDSIIVFELAQNRSDQGIIHSKFANVLLRLRQGLKNMAASQKEKKSNNAEDSEEAYQHTALEESTRVSDFDVAMAIQQSLQDLRKQQQEKSKQELMDDDTHVTVESTLSTAEHPADAASTETSEEKEWCIVNK
mmetsp:Transcript_37040/g.80631  ORF Transcript_37040/g.80631 Transcript_37040/m.80631 type:complete len:479 (+) Transcript_37040:73-1509(+)